MASGSSTSRDGRLIDRIGAPVVAVVSLVLMIGVRRLLLAAGVAIAATVATLTLTGSVPLILEITVAPTPAASNLNLTIDLPRTKVADLVVRTNSVTGYTVSVQSEHVLAGDCVVPCLLSTTSGDSLPFTLYRDAAVITYAGPGTPFVVASVKSLPDGDAYDVGISYQGASANLARATDYYENLTFTVSVN
jgi:hypothetical protein